MGRRFRTAEPDAFLGFIFSGVTMGQILSLPMLAIGLYLALRTRPWRRPLAAGG
jgi:phosphatidylglycerol:prolipoprotein diacylglycerol transferase